MPKKTIKISEIEASMTGGITQERANEIFKTKTDGESELGAQYGYPVSGVLQDYDTANPSATSVLSANAIIQHCGKDPSTFKPVFGTKYASGSWTEPAVQRIEADQVITTRNDKLTLRILTVVPDGNSLTDFDIIVKIFRPGDENNPTKQFLMTFPQSATCQFILAVGYAFSFSTTEPIIASKTEIKTCSPDSGNNELWPFKI